MLAPLLPANIQLIRKGLHQIELLLIDWPTILKQWCCRYSLFWYVAGILSWYTFSSYNLHCDIRGQFWIESGGAIINNKKWMSRIILRWTWILRSWKSSYLQLTETLFSKSEPVPNQELGKEDLKSKSKLPKKAFSGIQRK